MWHINNPLNEDIPLPNGVESLEAWGNVVVTMEKHRGLTFRQILHAVINGDREMQKYCGWIISKYARNISRNPQSQAPDLAAYLLRSGWDPDMRARANHNMSGLFPPFVKDDLECGRHDTVVGLYGNGAVVSVRCGAAITDDVDWL